MVLLVGLIVLIYVAYQFKWDWTGFNQRIGPNTLQYQSAKTLWDWLQLLFVPVVLTLGAIWFTARQNHDREIAREQHQNDRDIALDNQQEAELQQYIDKMSELLLVNDLRQSTEDAEVRKIARVRTLTVLRRLDAERKGSVLRFLHESGLIDKDKRIIDLSDANLGGANLIDADLSEANLSEANLRRADLRGAFLRGANLRVADLSFADLREADLSFADLRGAGLEGANLRGANLSEADLGRTVLIATLRGAGLEGANLSDANLSKANLSFADLREANLRGARGTTPEQLDTARSLKDTIMPDGSKHP
jgi:uncharacterized protein YjbI with pentapeptide repeats